MTKILALDNAIRFGWAHHSAIDLDYPVSGSERLPSPDGSTREGFDYGPTFAAFYEWVWEKIEEIKPDRIAYEAPLTPRGGNLLTTESTIRVLHGLSTITELVGELHAIPVVEMNVQQVKKMFAGHGHAKKEEIIARCRLLKWAPVDHNAADALAVWACARSMVDPGFSYRTTPLGRALA